MVHSAERPMVIAPPGASGADALPPSQKASRRPSPRPAPTTSGSVFSSEPSSPEAATPAGEHRRRRTTREGLRRARELDREGRALAHGALHADVAAVRLHHLLDD